MRLLSLFCFVLVWGCFAIAKPREPSFSLDVGLKKDEVLVASIASTKHPQNPTSAHKRFTLRWTLYRNEGLVVLVRYDHYPYQFILYRQYAMDSWKLNLLDSAGVQRDLNQPELVIRFLGIDDPFNDEKTVAHLRIYGTGDVSFSRE